jgi:hypothetical protein
MVFSICWAIFFNVNVVESLIWSVAAKPMSPYLPKTPKREKEARDRER